MQAAVVHAQSAPIPLRVYIECQECYINELKEKLTFVQYVRDRSESDVHVKTHSEKSGRGGRRMHLQLLGRDRFEGLTDTFQIDVESWESSTEVSNKLEKLIRAGLVRYMVLSDNLDKLMITQVAADPEKPIVDTLEDPWDHWNVQLNIGGWTSGESNYNNLHINGSIRAYRVTKASKWNFSFSNNFDENNYEFTNGETLKSIARGNNFDATSIFSIAERWSAGLFGVAATSKYYNLKQHFALGPGIEYAFFPYEESSYRHLMLQYKIKGHLVKYIEETIYDKMEEQLVDQSLKLAFLVRKDWGTIELDLTGSTYLHDLEQSRLDLYTSLDLNIVAGLSLSIDGGVQYANDQLYLPKRGASEEETLLRRIQLKTNYSYWSNVGFSYTFGSSDASIVNSRFGS
jgi:hypothetical protein